MSRKGAKVVDRKPTCGPDVKANKRERSPSDDTPKPRKLKCSDLNSRSSKPAKSKIDHVKRYLTEASEQELDRLANFLRDRKSERSSNSLTARVLKADAQVGSICPGDVVQPWRRDVSGGGDTGSTRQKVLRRITARGLAEAQAALFPEEQVARRKKIKLCERWSGKDRTCMEFGEEPDVALDKPPGLDICDTILSKAQTTY